jgi:hypothetical protein
LSGFAGQLAGQIRAEQHLSFAGRLHISLVKMKKAIIDAVDLDARRSASALFVGHKTPENDQRRRVAEKLAEPLVSLELIGKFLSEEGCWATT